MVDFQHLLDQAVAPVAPSSGVDAGPVLNNPFLQKENQIAQAAAEKKASLAASSAQPNPMAGFPDFYGIAAGMGNQSGAATMDPLEKDLRTMQPLDLYMKYGPSAIDLLSDMAAGGTDYFRDTVRRNSRTVPEVVFDSATGAASSFVGGMAGLAALGTGLVHEGAGTWLGDKVQSGMQWVNEHQSEGVNASRRVQQAKSALDFRDNAYLRQQEIDAGSPEIVADLRRIGRDAMASFGNAIDDPVALGQGTSEAIGSFLVGGPITKGLKALGAPVVKAMRAGGLPARHVDRLIAAGNFAAWPAAIAGIESGGVYQETASDILGMDFTELEKVSPTFRELVASGMTKEDARIRVANQSGLFAAAIQAPVAGATGMLTRFGERPFQVPSITSAARNVLFNEPTEEAIQSASGALAQNIATQRYADETKVLSEGVGEPLAQGALYGMTAAGAVQTPGVGARLAHNTGRVVYQGTRAAARKAAVAGKPLFNALIARGERIIRDVERASPVADEAISAAAESMATTAPQDTATIMEGIEQTNATPEQKAHARSFLETLSNNLLVDVNDESLPEAHRQVIQGSTTRADAIQRMAREVANTEGPEQLEAAGTLWYLLEPIQSLQENDPEVFSSIPQDHPANTLLKDYTKLVADIDNTPAVQRALRAINEIIAKNQVQQNIQPVTEESLKTAEGQQNVRNVLAIASLHPDQGNLKVNEQILTHAANGRLNLTPQQLNTLRASTGLLRAREKMEKEIADKGLRSAKDVVSSQILAGNDPLRKIAKSALQHTQGILSAKGGNNDDLAAARLEDFGRFVQHMRNKLEANIKHYNQRDSRAPRVPFMQLQANEERDFKLTSEKDSEYINLFSTKSVDHSQTINMEANILADVYNGLVATFPELNQQPITMPAYPQELQRPAAEVVASARAGTLYPTSSQETVVSEQETIVQEAQSPETTEGEAQPEESKPQTGLTEKKARRLSDEELSNRLNKVMDVEGYLDNPEFQILTNEMERRETVEANKQATPPVQKTSETATPVEEVVQPAVEAKEKVAPKAKPEAKTEVKAKSETVTKVEVEVEAKAETKVEVEETKPALSGIRAVFPNLYTGIRNLFLESFQLPEEPKTHLFAEESPANTVRRVLSSDMRLQTFLSGSQLRNTLTAQTSEAYQELLSPRKKGNTLGHLLSNVSGQLQKYLNQNYSKSLGKTRGQIFLENIKIKTGRGDTFMGGDLNRTMTGKVLNIVEQVGNGFQYNQYLLEVAGLATMQWLLSSNNYQTNMDEQDVSDYTGIPVAFLTSEIIEQVTQGMSAEQAIQTLSQKISKYWGLSAKIDADIAYTDGIPQAMAAEMIRGLEAMGLISIQTVKITKEQHRVEEPRTIDRYVPTAMVNADNSPHALMSFPDAIETAVLVEPENTNYFDTEVPSVAQRQMNNPDVPNTRAQKDAIRKEQKTPFYVNRTMVGLFTSLGRDNLLRLFGTNITKENEDEWNINHRIRLEGQNTNIVSAYQQMLSVVSELQNVAQTLGRDMEDVAVRYAYNMSRVARMQMLGKYNPQASKLMREAILPTRSTLDLSNENSDTWNAYTLGLAQALGIKVHNQDIETSQAQLYAMFNGGLAPAVEIIREWLRHNNFDDVINSEMPFTTEQVEALRAAFTTAKADLTMVGLHALVDWTRLQNTTDRSNYQTSIYLEADGVTNGPINALALMTIGHFSKTWLKNMSRGGVSFGPKQSLAEIKSNTLDGDSKDLYQITADDLRERLLSLRNRLSKQKIAPAVAVGQLNQLLSMLDLFIPDVTFNLEDEWDDDALEMKRGITKNPLTITVYGSGANGIAGNVVDQLAREIYARMSQVIQIRKRNPKVTLADAMFPNDPDAQAKADRFQSAYNALTRQRPFYKNREMRFEQVGQRRTTFNPQTFTFSASELETIQANILELFVKPMRDTIEFTMGEPLMKAVGLLRDATQIQSVVLESMYMLGIEEKLADKEENDPNWRRGDFLSQSELREIQKNLREISPLIETGDQNFMIASSQRVEVAGRDFHISASLDGRMRSYPNIYAPGKAGVRAIPLMVIGMGDASMMQHLAQQSLEGTLKVFDGMNMPLDKINEQSEKANEAVYESWKGNPLQEVSKSFKRFLKYWDNRFVNAQTYDALAQVLFSPAERREQLKKDTPFSAEQFHSRIKVLDSNLSWAVKSANARHRAMQSLPMSVDQMAAAGAPFHNGRAVIEGMTEDQLLDELNDRYESFLAEETEEESSLLPEKPVAPPKPAPFVGELGRVSSTGARVLGWTALTNLGRTKALTEAQKTIFNEIRRSLAARDYKIIVGNVEQLDAYIEQKGLSPRPSQEVYGWTNIGDKTIYLVNPSVETLVHELVHAASYEILLAHYSGDDLGTNAATIKDAISRLETLMAEFLSLDQESMDPAFRVAYDSAYQAILSSNLEADQAIAQAKALNEFMAWALTNEQLTKKLKQKQVPALVQLAKNVIQAIKNLIWGRKIAPKALDDFLSNLQFNSGIVIRSQPSIATINRNGELFHAPAYGTNERLGRVRATFGKKIVDLLASEKFQKDKSLRQVEVSDAQMLAIDVALSMNAHGFNMTMQENATFRMIVSALATEAELDPNALAYAQKLYTHVSKNLTVEHFMADPESLDPSVRYYAQEKYDSVMGKHITRTDALGRSSLMPAFLGLAVVSDEFRDILAKLPLPQGTKNTEGTLDALLENVANTGMDSLSRRLSGDVSSKNVQEAVDNLIEHVKKVAQDEQTFIDQYANKAGGILDRGNDFLRDALEKLSDIAMEKATDVEKNSKTALARTSARMTRLLAAVATEKNGAIVAEQTMAMLNKANVWEPFHDLAKDLVGRTSSNALVYDLIKVTRSMVQQVRQQFREETPRIIMSKFKGKMDAEQWSATFRSMAKTDLALLRESMSFAEISELFQDRTALDNAINTLEQQIQAHNPRYWNRLQEKARQLANFMNTGVAGRSLLRNAYAVSTLYGVSGIPGYRQPPKNIIKALDKLITLYSVEGLSEADRNIMSNLVQEEAEGISFMLDYLVGQRKEEISKATTDKARLNSFKGYIPSEQQQGVSLIVADDSKYASLRQRGYVRVADYRGSSTQRNVSQGYYYSPLSGRAVFNQGIMQNVRLTTGGVDRETGYTITRHAGRITEPHEVRRLSAQMQKEQNLNEALMPIWNKYGQVIALEKAIDPVQWERLQPSEHLPRMIGVWRGRQAEEGMAPIFNKKLIDNLRKVYEKDMQESKENQKQYVNLMDTENLTPVQRDAVNLFTDQTKDYIREVFGNEFWVRKDMLDDAIGYRSAGASDIWTGNSNWSPETLETVQKLVASVFGIKAYRRLVGGERVIQNFMADARTLIVIKSVIVPAINLTSNIYQLISRGVPILSIVRGMPRILGEIDSYAKTRLRQIDAEAELRAASDLIQQRKLKAEIQSINDAHKRLSIWPLIQAGEFSTIADVGMTSEDLELTSGKLGQYMENMVNKLPKSVQNAGRYALVTRDTALFQGLQKSVQYGDFIAKAILYQDLTKRQKKTKEYALSRITEEFVNYDRLPGRFRSYLENMGLLWFYNFKIRIAKVAVSTIRNNPLHALLAMSLPMPTFFGNVDLPQADSMFSKLWEGTLGYSIGPEMGLKAPLLNPWYNLID